MSVSIPFIIEKEGRIELNEEVLELIENSTNPNLLLFYGKTRRGKSTTLNQLIRGNHETWKFKNKKPFYAFDSIESITKGCDIFGPVKASILVKRHMLDINIEEDFDVFFCDTEGFSSLDGISSKLISGILTLLQLCTISVSISSRLFNNEDLKELFSQIQISRFMKKINNSLPSPLIVVYITNILFGNGDEYDNDEEKESYEKIKNLYEESRIKQKNKILQDLNDKKNINFDYNDIEIIPGGKYLNIKREKEPDHNDPFVKLYWDSIKDILVKFINAKKNNDSKQLVTWIKFLFEIFKNVQLTNDDLNLDNIIKNYITKSFENFSKEQFEIKKNKIKEDINNNLQEYINILNDDQKAKKNLIDFFDKNMMEIYQKLIPDKINDFINLSIEKYRVLIKEELNKKFESICGNILSDNNINELIKDIILMINSAKFKDEINYEKIKIYKLWKDIYEQQKFIFEYFKKTNLNVLNNLKESFISKINEKLNSLIDKKKNWEDYFKEKMVIINENIDLILFGIFKKYKYKEDLEMFKIQYDENYNKIYYKIFTMLKKEYFNDISEEKLIQINKNINKIFKIKYDKIISNENLPSWKNIKSEINVRIKKLFGSFISKIIYKKEFIEDINFNLCNKTEFLNIIPPDFMQKNQVTNDKLNEIKELINNEIDNNIIVLNNKINELPSFENFIKELLNKCSLKLDKKIKELFNKTKYVEDRIIFDSDIMFSFLTKDLTIYENATSKIDQINTKLKELCNKKADEYIIQIFQNKPEWEKDKNQILYFCKQYKNLVFKKVLYQEDIKPITKDDLLKNNNNLKILYDKVESNKKEEFNNILEKTIEEISKKQSSLPRWSNIKQTLLQESIIEMENSLKLDIQGIKKKYKSNYPGIDDRDMLENILIWKVNEKKILDQCLDKKRKEELYNKIKDKAQIIINEYLNREKKKEEEKIKRQNEIKESEKNLNIIKGKLQKIKKETAQKEMEINNIFIQKNKFVKENSNIINAQKLEIEKLKNEQKSNWRKFIGKNVQIRSILGNKNLDIMGAGRNNCVPIVLFDAHGQANQRFKVVLNGDNSVSFIFDRFAIDVDGGRVENCNKIQIYERNGTNAQKFFIKHEWGQWFSLHSALNQNYCIDINGGYSDNLTKVQLYQNNGSNAQKFTFIE